MALRAVKPVDDLPSGGYPFDLAAVRGLPLTLSTPITTLVGDNGSGKSTLVEAIAVAAGFNPEGGSGHVRFETHSSHSDLSRFLQLVWDERLPAGWFLRAETFYNVATFRDHSPGPHMVSYHEMSHGEAFLTVARDWFDGARLFILDEPESALSFHGQLALLGAMIDAVALGAQFILATHSPVLMAAPDSTLIEVTPAGLTPTSYDDLEVVGLWRSFLDSPQRFLRHLPE